MTETPMTPGTLSRQPRSRAGLASASHADDARPVLPGRRLDGTRTRQPLRTRGCVAHRVLAVPLHQHARRRVHDAQRQLPIWNEDWQARVQMAIDDAGKERPVSDMIHQRIGDYDAFKEYQRTVFDRTEAHIAAMDPADFQRVLVAPPYPPQIASTYSAMCAGPAGITVLDGYECWLYQHGLRHMGEIELARGLVGLEGMTS